MIWLLLYTLRQWNKKFICIQRIQTKQKERWLEKHCVYSTEYTIFCCWQSMRDKYKWEPFTSLQLHDVSIKMWPKSIPEQQRQKTIRFMSYLDFGLNYSMRVSERVPTSFSFCHLILISLVNFCPKNATVKKKSQIDKRNSLDMGSFKWQSPSFTLLFTKVLCHSLVLLL